MVQSVHQFAEKVALVTDIDNPVGRAVTLQLGLQGCYVIGVEPGDPGSAGSAVEQLRELGTLAHGVTAAVWTEAGSGEAVSAVVSSFGRLDLLVNCLKPGSESAFSESVDAAWLVTAGAADLMTQRPKPKIVNVGWGGAAATLAELTVSLAGSLPPKFRVNCVIVDQDEENTAVSEDVLLRPRSAVAPDDVARVVTFLLSPESVVLNGQVLHARRARM